MCTYIWTPQPFFQKHPSCMLTAKGWTVGKDHR
jgi:hypothetical protein